MIPPPNHHSQRRDQPRIGAEGALAPVTHFPALAWGIRDRDGNFAGVRREADDFRDCSSPTRAAVFQAAAHFLPRIFHVKPSVPTIPYPEQVQDCMGGLAWSDKSLVEIQQIE